MARLERMSPEDQVHIPKLPCPTFETTPWVPTVPLSRCRLVLISTAGLHLHGDRPFKAGDADYRIIPVDTRPDELIMSHISTNYDRSGFQQDCNVVFPLQRLKELAAEGTLGSLAEYHYAFMGATDPRRMEPYARALAGALRQEGVDAALLVPV